MNNDNKDLMNLFEKDGVFLPENLKKENIVKRIKSEQIKQDKKEIKLFPKIVAVGAAAAIAVTCVSIFPNKSPVRTSPAEKTESISIAYAPIDLGINSPALSQFEKKEDVQNYFLNISEAYRTKPFGIFSSTNKFYYGTVANDDGAVDFVEESKKLEINTADDLPTSAENNHGETNTQVEGVDEADIIKNDGKYIYTLSYDRFSIIDTEKMDLVYQEQIKPESKNSRYEFDSMYIVGSKRLVLTGNLREYEEPKKSNKAKNDFYLPYNEVTRTAAVSLVYDISDKTAPKKINSFSQDGYIHSSRMVGDVLYTVSQYNVPLDTDKKIKNSCIPSVNGVHLDVSDIYATSIDDSYTSYIILTGYDTSNPNSDIGKVAVLGNCDNIYCTQYAMYVTHSHPEFTEEDETCDDLYYDDLTDIHSFSLNGTSVSYGASGCIPGIINNQYSMDADSQSNLRLTTAFYDYKKDVEVSNLYILDASLKVIGMLENIAEDEQIKSTRFMGNTAYVVTFRNTDPLFVIDLSDPSKPEIKGEVKLPGFSQYLHPVGNGLLIGVGYDGDEESSFSNKIKISLFDVSDPAAPKEIDKYIMKNARTEANYNSKSFVFDKETNTLGIPVTYESYSGSDFIGSKYFFKMLTVKDNKLCDEKAYYHGIAKDGKNYWWSDLFRGTFIGNKVYTVTQTDIKEFDRSSCEQLRALNYAEYENNLINDIVFKANY